MASFNRSTIDKLTHLCRISCTDKESEALLHDLKKIVDYIEQLSEVDTEQVEPCNHVLASIVNVMREDVTGQLLQREVFLKNAPSQVSGMIRVPTIIKQK